jgi:hypothetical protein
VVVDPKKYTVETLFVNGFPSVRGPFFPIDRNMAVIGTDDAARWLNVSVRRLTAMIRSGIVKAQKIGRTWVLEESEVLRVQKLSRPRGRPRKKK